jgi:hypothetical protein
MKIKLLNRFSLNLSRTILTTTLHEDMHVFLCIAGAQLFKYFSEKSFQTNVVANERTRIQHIFFRKSCGKTIVFLNIIHRPVFI